MIVISSNDSSGDHKRGLLVRRENKDVEANPVDDIKPERFKEAPTKEVKAGTEEDDIPQEKLKVIIGEERNETEVDRSPQNTNSEKNQIEVSEQDKYVEPEKRTSATTLEAKQFQQEERDATENTQAIQNQNEDDDDLPSKATIWTTMAGFFGCLSVVLGLHLPPVRLLLLFKVLG